MPGMLAASVDNAASFATKPEVNTSAASDRCSAASSRSSKTCAWLVPEMLRVPPAPAPEPSASFLRDADKAGAGRQQQRAILHVPVAIDRLSRGIGGAFVLRLSLDLGRAAAKAVIADPDPLPGGLAGRGRLRQGRIGAERAAAAQGRRRDQQKGGAKAHAVSAKARSRKRPAAIRRASAPIRATSCTPVGRPLSPQIAGSVRQGVPSRVHMRLKTGSPV